MNQPRRLLWGGREGTNSAASFGGPRTPVVAYQPRSLRGTSGTGDFGGLPAQATSGGEGGRTPARASGGRELRGLQISQGVFGGLPARATSEEFRRRRLRGEREANSGAGVGCRSAKEREESVLAAGLFSL
ncbi:hypothetical protein TIFTF001_008137 [Ficus carica]|uniref:Uncharacterized protein n=1 Tax=Ficus carica TaxID=3494 RepID=A0AA87ZRX9_FICCA|nr:hypothetical protein TIFTF001_008137 [Ficus carica]